MSRTITAMFDSRSEAEAARERLTASNIDASRVRIIDNQSSGSSSYGGSSSSSYGNTSEDTETRGFWAQMKELFVPDEDRHSYAEGVSRGGVLLTAEVDEDQADEACRILEQSSSVDFDSREREWRNDSWAGFAGADSPMGSRSAMTDSSFGSTGSTTGQSFAGATGDRTADRGHVVAEEHIPIVEEQLRVGKREVNRGGVRVRSYVREVPVHEQVTLREEHVDVERRPVNQPVSAAGLTGDVFQEKNVELTETAEEAVVAKEAQVREELVVKKTAEEHVEQIDDTVRRTEVDVEGGENRSALFGNENRTAGTSGSTGFSDNDLERTNRDRGSF
jgi:uncharacterized protein (TIGR02271 family)